MKPPAVSTRKLSGFTLLEVLVSATLFAGIVGSSLGLLSAAAHQRYKADELKTAVSLARQKMNSIKASRKVMSDRGDFETFAGYQYEVSIEEEEIDLAKMAEQYTSDEEENSDDPMQNYLAEQGLLSQTVTGAVFKMLKYNVTVSYSNNRSFTLTFYRGLGVY